MMLEMWDDDDDFEDEYGYGEEDEEPLDLGPCCACGREDESVRNIIMLPQRTPIEGTGWGCVQCGLPMDGALAVICDECAAKEFDLVYCINGMAAQKGRALISNLSDEPFDHDMSKHPEVQPFRNAYGVMTSNFDVVGAMDAAEVQLLSMPAYYLPPHQTPFYWRDEVTGVLPAAMAAYINHFSDPDEEYPPPTEQDIALVIDYCRYFINAPCWQGESVPMLRERAAKMDTWIALNFWLQDCLKVGIDPL